MSNFLLDIIFFSVFSLHYKH